MTRTAALLTEAFERMLKQFGPRDWWPGETPFEVMVGAILTQNTNWKNVEKAIGNLKAASVLDPRSMLSLDPERLSELIRPAGYFRIKAARLHAFLQYFVQRYEGDAAIMAEQSLTTLREELLSVRGIGPETADSILLYALQKPVFVIDAYTKRILSRHAMCNEEDGYVELQELFSGSLPEEVERYNEYHALIVEVGKQFCRPQPRCDSCPLKGLNNLPSL